jgi:protein SCO1/2
MMKQNFRAVVSCAATLSLAAMCVMAVPVQTGADNSRWGADYFPNVTFTTQDGTRVRFYDDLLKGKIVAINLIYTTCKYSCPLETARMAQVQKLLGDRMGRDVFFYSITIDPEHDTPEVLKEYGQRYHAGPGWLFLTGTAADIQLVSRKLGLYSPPNPANPDGHIPYLLVGNEATGQWMRNSAVDNPKFLATTIGDWLDSWHNAPKQPPKSYAEVPRPTFDRGQYTFTNHCAACHTIGRGEQIGPDLLDVTAHRERSWLTRFIVAPDKMNAAGDPIAAALRAKYQQVRMPNLDLNDADAALLIDYIAEQSRQAQRPAHSAEPAPAVASPAAASAFLAPIVESYLRIQQALHGDTLDGIKPQAQVIAARAAELGVAFNSIRASAATFDRAGDLASARAAFGALSDAILVYAKEANAPLGDTVTAAYCPMVRRHWLQRGATVQNPFYGSAMSDCGRVVSGIPSVNP